MVPCVEWVTIIPKGSVGCSRLVSYAIAGTTYGSGGRGGAPRAGEGNGWSRERGVALGPGHGTTSRQQPPIGSACASVSQEVVLPRRAGAHLILVESWRYEVLRTVWVLLSFLNVWVMILLGLVDSGETLRGHDGFTTPRKVRRVGTRRKGEGEGLHGVKLAVWSVAA